MDAPGPEQHVTARRLRKSYGEAVAVADIDLDIPAGESFGILGPNGAGKSSTMRMIGCVSAPTAGTLRLFGVDSRGHEAQLKQRLGVVPQENCLDRDLTVLENLVVYGRYFGLGWRECRRRSTDLLELVQLESRADDQVGELSGGMQRRLAIARALVNSPEMLLLDEPTTGLDPQARQLVWNRLRGLQQSGTTLVVTTHYMDEAEQLCDRLVVLNAGQVIAAGSPAELISLHAGRDVVQVRTAGQDSTAAVERLQLLSSTEQLADRLEVLTDQVLLYADDGETARRRLTAAGFRPHDLSVRRSTLEDVFLRLTGRALVD